MSKTTISIEKRTRERLARASSNMHETYDEVINKLLDNSEKLVFQATAAAAGAAGRKE